MEEFEYSAVNEAQFDFCLWPYPAQAPGSGKLRSVNLLFNSFAESRLGPQASEIVSAIRREFGLLRTVWGIKQASGTISWEFYFYDYERTARSRSVSGLLRAVQPWLGSEIVADEGLPYFMFSIDLSGDQLCSSGTIDEVQIYIGNVGSSVSSGICYGLAGDSIRLKNFYFFFDARQEMELIEGKVQSSAYLGEGACPIDEILLPELRDCDVIVVANKTDRDGVYFSRIRVNQLIWFLRRMGFPHAEVEWIERNRDRLDHMLFDVGFDYRMEAGCLKVVKSAYYGVF